MDLEQRLDCVIAAAIAERRIVGAVLLVHKDGRPLYEKAHGLADREAAVPMRRDTIFRYSSLTKPLVAATILALVDDGKLRLDDLVTRFLPHFRPKVADGIAPDITIHHLLTHTSGLNTASILTPSEEAAGVNRWRLGTATIMERLAGLELLFAPGTGWTYGPSIDVLGVIAGQLVGGTPGDAIARYVTGPLQMKDTQFGIADLARLAAPYADSPTGAVRMSDPHSVPNLRGGMTTYDPSRILDGEAFQSGGGGAAGTGPDFMMLLDALRSGGGPILKPETVAMGLANQTPELAQAADPGTQFSYFGAYVENPQTAQVPLPRGSNRWGGIYGHNWIVDPQNGLCVVSMSNTGMEGCMGAYRDDVGNAVYAAL